MAEGSLQELHDQQQFIKQMVNSEAGWKSSYSIASEFVHLNHCWFVFLSVDII